MPALGAREYKFTYNAISHSHERADAQMLHVAEPKLVLQRRLGGNWQAVWRWPDVYVAACARPKCSMKEISGLFASRQLPTGFALPYLGHRLSAQQTKRLVHAADLQEQREQ